MSTGDVIALKSSRESTASTTSGYPMLVLLLVLIALTIWGGARIAGRDGGALTAFRYLKVSLAIVLAMVGTKMLAHHWLQQWLGEHFNLYMLAAIVLILGTGISASLVAAPARNASS